MGKFKDIIVRIIVSTEVKPSEWDYDDRNEDPTGEYYISVPNEFDEGYYRKEYDVDDRESAAEQYALDNFHNSIPISCLDVFDIDYEVIDSSETEKGRWL